MVISINTRYKFMQGLFWMLYCAGSGFISLYLQGCGIGTVGIGTVTAFFGITAALMQPLLGSICDRSSIFNWKNMILILSVIFAAVCAVMIFINGVCAGAILIGLLILTGNLIMPFVNNANFYYLKKGENINFGIARGIGSASYAIVAFIIGKIAAVSGIRVIPSAGLIIAVLFFAAVIIMPYQKSEKHNEIKRTRMKKGFFSSYRPFTVMMGACLMMLTTHNILCTYLLQIIQSFGGNSSNLGTALAIQAIVEVPVMFCFSRLLRHFSPAVLMMTASFGFILKAIMFLISSDILMLYLTQLTQMVSFALFASASVYYTAESVSDEDQGMGQACMTSMMAAGTVCGSLLGGWILKVTGIHELLLISLLISAFGVILAAISVRMGRHKTPAEEVSRYE